MDTAPLVLIAALIAVSVTPSCGGDEPVLSGVPVVAAPGTPARAAEDAPEGEPLVLQGGSEEEAVYQRPAGVLVDVRYLGGKPYSEVRDVVTDQLGALESSTDMPGDGGRELAFERGKLRIVGERIYRVYVSIEPSLRRTAALEAVGFPAAAGRYITLHREFRLSHEWGFRRIRLMREDRRSELVNAVDAWYKVPGEGPAPR